FSPTPPSAQMISHHSQTYRLWPCMSCVYKVEALLGEGTFGIVAKCRDTKTNQAILDPDAPNIVKWNGFFHDGERVCLNFKLLDQCLWDYIGDRNNQGLPISKVGPILGQLTNALSHLGSVGIVHADLKPGNIVVVNRHESPVKVRLTDFGLACPASAVNPSDCVGTVGYSAPEVMLGLPYNEARSLGLVAVELATGVPLYPVENECDYLKFIIETQGQPPDHVLDSGVYTDDYFIEDNYKQQRWTFKTEEQFQYETGYPSLETLYIKLKRLDDLEQIMKVRRGPEDDQSLFVSLIKEMLALDAHQRITPSEVLRHPFFNPGLSNSKALQQFGKNTSSPSLFRAETQTERDVSASVKAPQVVHKQTKPSYSHWHSLTFDSQRNAALTRLSMTAHSLTLS
uniref:Protein kinase domain-containing protein n=1 Tax=Neolamprologus brichardi TaxID=32507 RepID=A0A3Q4HZ36_NEOBR